MSSEPIICRYEFTTKEFRRALLCHWKYSRLKWWLLVFIVGMTCISLYTDYFSVAPEDRSPAIYSVLAPAFVAALVFFAIFYLHPFLFRRTALHNKEMVYSFHADGIHLVTPVSETNMKWALYVRVTENKNGFALFHQGKRTFNWLPKSGFANVDEINRYRELLREKVQDSKRLFAG